MGTSGDTSGHELFATETMAELCARQGRIADAVAIYRRLLERAADDPRRDNWQRRLAALQAEPQAAGRPTTAASPPPAARASARGDAPTAAEQASTPASDGSAQPAASDTVDIAIDIAVDLPGDEPTLPDVAAAASPDAAPVAPPVRLPLTITQPVRSGQIVYAQGGDLVVLAPVNSGAELIADGNIHVYAALRGRAVAGAHGERRARIFCQKLEAELVGIDTAYLTSDDLPERHRGKPVQVVFEDDRCVILPL